MRKWVVLAGLAAALSIPGSGAERNVLVEMFTNSYCGLCPPAHSALHAYENTSPNGSRVRFIFYHVTFPYSDDPLAQANTLDASGRNQYYGPFSATPVTFFDGVNQGNAYSSWASALDTRMADSSPLSITLGGTRDGNDISVKATLQAEGALPAGTLVIHFVIVEEVAYAGRNGISPQSFVMRKMIGGPNGQTLSIAAGETKVIEQLSPLLNVEDPSKAGVVVFVQEVTTKAVLQSEYVPYDMLSGVAGVPGLVSPADLAQNQPSNLMFEWRSAVNTDTYQLQVSTDSLFSSGIAYDDSTLVDTTQVVSGLQQNTLYFWRVRGRNDGGPGPFSPVRSFRTSQALPSQVELIAPAHQATVSSESAVFQWFYPGGPTSRYWFEIGTDSTFSMPTDIDSLLTDTTKVFSPLTSGKTYYWRVRGGNLSEWGPFSLVRSFSVIITGVEEETQTPDRFTLSQNYPNPFNPSTQISFAIPEASEVRLGIYDLLGQEVRTLVQEQLQPGTYEVSFDGTGLPSGAYFYRLQANGFVATRRLVLLK